MKLISGQTVFVEGLSNHHRDPVKQAVVEKVGKKYFTLRDMPYTRFIIDTMLHDGRGYSPDYRIYTSEKEITEKKEAEKLHKKIKEFFHRSGTNLEKLRQIAAILWEKEDAIYEIRKLRSELDGLKEGRG